jgi:hypothetical protein
MPREESRRTLSTMSLAAPTDDTVEWLLQSGQPALRRLAAVRLLGRDPKGLDIRGLDPLLRAHPWMLAIGAVSVLDAAS